MEQKGHRRWKVLAVAVLAAGTAGGLPSVAEQSDSVYEESRRDASMHLQLEVEAVTRSDDPTARCRVFGKVVRVFRDWSGPLNKGQPVQVSVDCRRPGFSPVVGAGLNFNPKTLSEASYLEVFLELSSPRIYTKKVDVAKTEHVHFLEVATGGPGLAPPAYASSHLLLEINDSELLYDKLAWIKGRVRTVYADESGLFHSKARLEVYIDCEPSGSICRRFFQKNLARSSFVEFHVSVYSPLDQVGIIGKPTRKPVCKSETRGRDCWKTEE